MANTWNDASKFTWDELRQLNLRWDDLQQLSTQELISIAQQQLKRFQQLPPSTAISSNDLRTIENLTNEVQELKAVIERQAPPSLPMRIAENIFCMLILNAGTWALTHPQEIRNALIQVILIIDQIVGS